MSEFTERTVASMYQELDMLRLRQEAEAAGEEYYHALLKLREMIDELTWVIWQDMVRNVSAESVA